MTYLGGVSDIGFAVKPSVLVQSSEGNKFTVESKSLKVSDIITAIQAVIVAQNNTDTITPLQLYKNLVYLNPDDYVDSGDLINFFQVEEEVMIHQLRHQHRQQLQLQQQLQQLLQLDTQELQALLL